MAHIHIPIYPYLNCNGGWYRYIIYYNCTPSTEPHHCLIMVFSGCITSRILISDDRFRIVSCIYSSSNTKYSYKIIKNYFNTTNSNSQQQNNTNNLSKPKSSQEYVNNVTSVNLSSSKSSSLGRISWKSLLLALFSGLGLLYFYNYEKRRLKQNSSSSTQITSYGRALIGGKFNLVNENGVGVSSSDLYGKYLLLYFGFTYCPDICPTEIQKIKDIENILKSEKFEYEFQPVFISIDPLRDNSKRLAEYKLEYPEQQNIIWLTGKPEEIESVAKSFRVYYSAPKNVSPDDTSYLVDHSIFFYLIDRKGSTLDYYGKQMTPQEIANKIIQQVKADNKKQ